MLLKLTPITPYNIGILDLVFLPEYIGFFRFGADSTPREKVKYKETLATIASSSPSFAIEADGVVAGFIIYSGRLVGGLLPEFTGKGIYKLARNTMIGMLNELGIFNVESTVDNTNLNMQSFIKSVPHTKLNDSVYINHWDPGLQPLSGRMPSHKVSVRKYTETELYHISFDDKLPQTLLPRLPDDSDLTSGQYPEPEVPRVSFSPSPELCLRAIYPNVSKVFEDSPSTDVNFHLYQLVSKPNELILPEKLVADRSVHDAHITLEHWVMAAVRIKYIGPIRFENTSSGEFLKYRPFGTGPITEHSPININLITNRK